MQIDEKYFKQPLSENTVESVFESDEKVILRTKPDKKAYICAAIFKMLPIALIWLCFDAAFLTIIGKEISGGNMPMAMLGVLIPFFIVHLAPVWIWISRIVKSTVEIKNIEYVFTDRRVIVRSGVIGIDFKFFYYDKIESVVAKVGLVDKLCKVGDIYITAAGTAGVIFDQPDPYQLATKLQRLATDFRSDINYPNALRPAENHGYKTEYAEDVFSDLQSGEERRDPLQEQPAPLDVANDKPDSAAKRDE